MTQGTLGDYSFSTNKRQIEDMEVGGGGLFWGGPWVLLTYRDAIYYHIIHKATMLLLVFF